MKIACLIPGGLGGTQKAGWLFADGLARLGHDVVGFAPEGPFFPKAKTELAVCKLKDRSDSFPKIADGRFDALHVHMPGYYIRHPIYPFLKSLGKKRPRVVETNVFGWLQDWRANPVTDYRLFISMTSAWQAAKRAGKTVPALSNCSVARYPVLPAPVFTPEERQKARRELGFGDEDIVALRFGRPDAAKWTDLECAATMQVRREGGKNLKLLVMEPPVKLKQRITSGAFGDGIVVREVETSPTRMATMVDACDIIFHAARFGESFGYAIAEGMAAGKPVITRTTPWGDNAQIELVEHGATGFVCCSQEGLTEALRLLVTDPNLRTTLGDAGRRRILSISDMSGECAILDAAICDDAQALGDRWEEIIDFARTIPIREWDVIEKSHAHMFAGAPEILHREMAHARSMVFKKKLSGLRANARALLGRPSYH